MSRWFQDRPSDLAVPEVLSVLGVLARQLQVSAEGKVGRIVVPDQGLGLEEVSPLVRTRLQLWGRGI